MIAMVAMLVIIILTGLSLSVWRLLDHRADRKAMHELAANQSAEPPVFSAAMIADLPEPVRRFFLYAIEPGTPLYTVTTLFMTGRFGKGNRDKPDYLDFEATQVLTVPAGITWESLAEDHARVTIDYRGLSQAVDLALAADGQPTEVRFQRWSNANLEKRHRLQPFGGYLSEFRSFRGFRLPTHVEAGNHFGTDQYFPFFVADITEVEFPHG